jgi:putative inorganic carbon (hco3(-)) transporter
VDARAVYADRSRMQFYVVAAATGLVALCWYFDPNPVTPAILALCFLALVSAYRWPFLVCLVFIALTYFRLHEAYPALYPLHLPFFFAAVTMLALGWHMFVARSIDPFFPLEIKFFLAFFVLGTAGVAYAIDRPAAYELWTSSFTKIGVMTLAIAWLPRAARDFQLAARIFVISGMLVAAVTIHNKFAGIGLVELTRVTVGRELNSMLADPNDLALVLLFPLSFSAALVVHRCGLFNRLLGLVSIPTILAAMTFTQSRGGLLGVIAVLGVFGLRYVRSRIFVAALAVVAALILYQAMGISGRVSGGAAEVGLDESAAERLDAWWAAVKMALARPLTGVGLANFAPNLYFFADDFPGRDMTAHSTWFGVLAETGLPGLVAFVGMVVAGLRSGMRSVRQMDHADALPIMRATALALVAGLVGFCAAGSFLSQGFTWPIYILVGLTAALSRYVGAQAALPESYNAAWART